MVNPNPAIAAILNRTTVWLYRLAILFEVTNPSRILKHSACRKKFSLMELGKEILLQRKLRKIAQK